MFGAPIEFVWNTAPRSLVSNPKPLPLGGRSVIAFIYNKLYFFIFFFSLLQFTVLGDDCISDSTDCDTAVTNSQCSRTKGGVFKCVCKPAYYGEDEGTHCEQSMLYS